MRTLPDRIRPTLLFEFVAILIVAFVGSWITGHSVQQFGVLGLMFSVLAMAWNLLFNWLFDHWELRFRPGRKRTVALRVIHAVLFELVLLIAGVFLIAWWLDMGLLAALVLDVGMSAFFVVYAFAFNWAYDMIFPIPRETA